jgi:hypothetical protein
MAMRLAMRHNGLWSTCNKVLMQECGYADFEEFIRFPGGHNE